MEDVAANSTNFTFHTCINFRAAIINNIAFTAMRTILSMPLCVLVLYLGHQRWRQQRSTTTSHSDIFTYHLAAMEMIWGLVFICSFCGLYANLPDMSAVGICAISFVIYGEIFFHVLTCVDRYLAVVHPIIYLGLKNVHGARIRNISTGCVWLLCSGSVVLSALCMSDFPVVLYMFVLVVSLIVLSFCSLSVLCVLIRPGPGKGVGGKEHVDQSKQRAFYTVTAIFGLLCLWFVGIIIGLVLYSSPLLSNNFKCMVLVIVNWLNVPSSLVLPLLYLHRAGKLSHC